MLKVLGTTIPDIVAQVTTLLGFVHPSFKAVLPICSTFFNSQKLWILPTQCI